jgi:N utilization substance protein B
MKPVNTRPSSRRSARLGAVQALYQMEQTNQGVELAIEEFIHHRFPLLEGEFQYFKPDVVLFKSLMQGVSANLESIDKLIEENLSENWRLERLPSVMRAILRSACYELKDESLVPIPVIINEYIEISKEFFQEKEVSFANGILDIIARQIRPAS